VQQGFYWSLVCSLCVSGKAAMQVHAAALIVAQRGLRDGGHHQPACDCVECEATSPPSACRALWSGRDLHVCVLCWISVRIMPRPVLLLLLLLLVLILMLPHAAATTDAPTRRHGILQARGPALPQADKLGLP
jgi:hypothetical protein